MPDPILILKALGAAVATAAVVLLACSWPCRRPHSPARHRLHHLQGHRGHPGMVTGPDMADARRSGGGAGIGLGGAGLVGPAANPGPGAPDPNDSGQVWYAFGSTGIGHGVCR